MAKFTKLSGDAGTEPTAVKFWREETRVWYMKFFRPIPASTLVVTVHPTETDADNSTNTVASGTVAITDTEHTVTLVNAGTAPTFTGATVKATLTATTTVGTSVWKIDLGVRLERCPLRIMRGFNTYVDGSNDYWHDLGTVELGVKQWEDVGADGDSDFPYVGVGRASTQVTGVELGSFPGPTRYDLIIACNAHNLVTGDSIDSNALALFHDLRRSLVDLNDETYKGDGPVYSVASMQLADFDRPVEWARDRVTIEFDVTVALQETRAEMVAG